MTVKTLFITVIFTALFIGDAPLCLGSDDSPTIQSLMSTKEFERCGLKKLTTEELSALNHWLIKYTANEAEIVKKNSQFVKESEDQVIQSRIIGKFYGWKKGATFQLENGQIWEQRNTTYWKTNMDNPEVVIRKNLIGNYDMEVVDAKRKIGVTRIK
ncbi:hypothetical protein QP938_12900 [Porticoccaceae bacterium LTM1]|nr:hypothetical protein QP938_12900 [Porticoccaceae bacterium LTM1]